MALNTELVGVILELAHVYELLGEEYRSKAYLKAAIGIKNLPYLVTVNTMINLQDRKVPGVGKGILEKIQEFVKTGKIKELDKLRRSRVVQAYEIFSKIAGVGPSTIAQWTEKKIYTLADLRKAFAQGKIKLTHVQTLGLKYYDDLNTRIPRGEITSIGKEISNIVFYLDGKALFTIAGSYRRQTQTSGDIDILISTREYNSDFLSEILSNVKSSARYVATLSEGEQRVSFLYRGAKVRQVDLLYIKYSSYYAALLYFTGSGSFNEYIRGLCKSRGYRLNQNGLYKVSKGGKLTLIPLNSEAELFNILEIRYVPPNERV